MKIKKTHNKANQVMHDRSSIRAYNTSVVIPREELRLILQDALTAPSSFNLQPWRLVVIDTVDGKEKIKPFMMFNGKQWETSSAIIAIFADLDNVSTTEQIYNAAYDNGLINKEAKNFMINTIINYTATRSQQGVINTAVFDCGLVTMQIMLSAKNYGYDTNPIGGFQKEEFAKALNMDTQRYLPLLLLSIGKADEKGHDSIRYSVDDITQWF